MQRVKSEKRPPADTAVPEFLWKITIALFLLHVICTAIPQAAQGGGAPHLTDRYPAAMSAE